MMSFNVTLQELEEFNFTTFYNVTLDDARQYTEFKIARWLNYLTPWIAFGIALLGNSAAFVTVLKMKPFTTVALFVCYLAVTDTLFVFSNFLYTQLIRYKIALGNAGCSSLLFVINFTIYVANWTVVTMTSERFTAVCYPFKVARMFTMRKSVLCLITLGAVWLIPTQFSIWVYQEIQVKRGPDCGGKPEYLKLIEFIHWNDMVCFALIPCVIIIILNIGIIRKVAQSRKLRQEVSDARSPLKPDGVSRESRERVLHGHLTAMLITVSVAHVLLQLPIAAFYIVEKYWNYEVTTRELVMYILVREIVHTLSELNHSLNFVFYFLSGRKFRQRFLELMKCRFLKRGSFLSSRGITSSTQASTVPTLDISVDSQGSVHVCNNCEKYSNAVK